MEHRIDGGYEPVMRFEPTKAVAPIKVLPTGLVAATTVDRDKAVARRQFILDSSTCKTANEPSEMQMGPAMCINGKSHDLARIDEEVKIGTAEIWEIFSIGMIHPFHIHGASFRILSISGQSPPAHLAGWKDVVLVEDRTELLVAFNQSATPQHPFMYHCHVLEHEDAGMMGQYICG
jgi:FtsP/CotA-like multicopper oxidase with cupredoxin domain